MYHTLHLLLIICSFTNPLFLLNAMDLDSEPLLLASHLRDSAPPLSLTHFTDPESGHINEFVRTEARELEAFKTRYQDEQDAVPSLVCALAHGNTQIRNSKHVKSIIDRVVSQNKINEDSFVSGFTPLSVALLSLGYSAKLPDTDSFHANTVQNIQYLLDKGADPSKQFNFFHANHVTGQKGAITIKRLLEAIQPIGIIDASKIRPVDITVYYNNPTILQALKDTQPALNLSGTLYTAIAFGHTASAQKLLELGVNPNERLTKLSTMKDYAVTLRNPEIIHVLCGETPNYSSQLISHAKVNPNKAIYPVIICCGLVTAATIVLGSLIYVITYVAEDSGVPSNSTNYTT